MTTGRFRFASGNLAKLLAIPAYLLSALLAVFVPRVAREWVFGSGIGVGEGALAVARELRDRGQDTQIVWLVADDREAEAAESEGFIAIRRQSWRGFWRTLRAGCIVVTHGLGDANRYGVFGGFVVQLWHGAPLKRLHLDSPVTTAVRGPALLGKILRRMYRAGANEVELYVAGSTIAADRLRSAFRVLPGKVRVLGDPRDDVLAQQARDPDAAAQARGELVAALAAAAGDQRPEIADGEAILLYAPTWRDGEADPAIPNETELGELHAALERMRAHLVVRPHPLGGGAYGHVFGGRIHALPASEVRDLTPLLGAVDTLITDYSSVALDFSLLGRPIVWFAPDLAGYEDTRGLYEPLAVTSGGRIECSWREVIERLDDLREHPVRLRSACAASRDLARRFHAHPEGGAAGRVLDEVARLRLPATELVDDAAIFFESFYGTQVSCNPLALDREIAERHPHLTRYWSVTSEAQVVPEGAVPLLVGGRDWFAARRQSQLLIVNDWLRFSFRSRRGQTVLQTWHGTMLKHLALGRPGISLRTRFAIRRESRRWGLLLSQNPHSTEQFRSSYAFRGEILELGYPRDDRLAEASVGRDRNPVTVDIARATLGVPPDKAVISYVPTWRDGGTALVDDLDITSLAEELGEEWVVLVRGHTRTHAFGSYLTGATGRVVDVSQHPDIADVILASDLLITDYSSVMFDASVARVPMAFFVPDLTAYRDRERGFTFDFEDTAPGPLLSERAEVVAHARQLRELRAATPWVRAHDDAYDAWRERFNPHDDGQAASRVVDELESRGAFTPASGR